MLIAAIGPGYMERRFVGADSTEEKFVRVGGEERLAVKTSSSWM